MQTVLLAKLYNQNLSFEQNFKDLMESRTMKCFLHQAYPEAFIEYDAIIKCTKQLKK